MSHDKETSWKPLGALESAVLNLLWQNGTLTADEVRQRLGPERELKDSTVRTLLRRLEAKGHVSHKLVSRTFRYRAVTAPRIFAAHLVEDIAARYCAGDMNEVLAGLVEEGLVDRRELKRAAKRH